MARYLVFASLDAALARSAEQADAVGCDPSHTTHWWRSLENSEDARGAVVIDDEGHYDATGLTPDEVAMLWAEADMGPGWFPAAPTVVDAPYVGQTGDQLSCTMGNWYGEPTSYAYQWQSGGVDVVGADAATHTVLAADAGRIFTCIVTASNTLGSASSTSNAVVAQAPARR